MKRIKMIMPVPMPAVALAAFESQIPASLRRDDVTIDFVAVKAGAKILDSYYEMTLADAFVLEAGATAEAEGYDAVCINSMSDSGVAALRSRLSIPVVGPGQSCVLTACMLGEKFSILTMWDQWRPLYKKAIQEQGLAHRVASVRSIDVRPDAQELLAGKEEIVFARLEAEGRAAIEQDGADVIIIGSTTMHQSHAYLADKLPVPVLNPGLVSLKLCEMLLDLGLSHSRLAYQSPELLNDDVFAAVPPAAL
ncbi:MAG TPA: hydrogenase expression protein HupH [Gammaproteobacteria bacterium]|nr:hydrogenase expression protein HupH [Gammaproteobacteria bacterium]